MRFSANRQIIGTLAGTFWRGFGRLGASRVARRATLSIIAEEAQLGGS